MSSVNLNPYHFIRFLNNILDEFTFYLVISFIAIFLSSMIFLILKKIILAYIKKLISKAESTWIHEFLESKLLDSILYIFPIMIIYFIFNMTRISIGSVYDEAFNDVLNRILLFALTLVGMQIINKILDTVLLIYDHNFDSNKHSIKGYVQLFKILNYILTSILAVCAILDKSPWGILSGMGALTAILMLVFKDTILSLVASIQISGNNLFMVGDWIEIPSFGVDGNVIDISLHTIKVSNWDKTIVNVPTHRLLEIGVKNWRGMELSKGRRIKRSLNIDFRSIRLLTLEEIENYKKIKVLKEYFNSKKDVIENYKNADINIENSLNYRRLTNIGTFRAYIEGYLLNHKNIYKDDFTFLIRQLQPNDKGLPIEIYCFANDNRWIEYENIQSDIFDHIIVAANEFNLKIYQSPTGNFENLMH